MNCEKYLVSFYKSGYLVMPREMKRIVNIANGFKEAEEWDIKQQINMTPDERFAVAKKIQEMFYGLNSPDVREWHRKK